MIKNTVIAKIEHTGHHPRLGPDTTIPINTAIRYGYCDFETDGAFNATNEEVIAKEFIFIPDIEEQDWTWNGTTFE